MAATEYGPGSLIALDGDTARWFVPVSSARPKKRRSRPSKPAMPSHAVRDGKSPCEGATDDRIA